ncbi:hypothetical protein [Salimicrobium halophilum]|uniref:Uncharacterized protein n=1 Tax=Salimicrobium halophilum TaxID=86666 RepID=A0A1G8UCH6_9BACI|nr:hypothetical protein [Salimicrobium halophilum]SDJ51422.1 hypothetical protein SAMN04490247_2174 [Salimicrobium halophilum]
MYVDSGYGFKWNYPERPSTIAFACIDSYGERHIHMCYEEEGVSHYRIVKQSEILRLDDPTRSFLMNRIVAIEEGIFDMSSERKESFYYVREPALV